MLFTYLLPEDWGPGLGLHRLSLQLLLSTLGCQWLSQKDETLILWNHSGLSASTIIWWVSAQALELNRLGFYFIYLFIFSDLGFNAQSAVDEARVSKLLKGCESQFSHL